MPLVDPPPAPEGGSSDLRAKDLKNKVIIIHPTGSDTKEGKEGPYEVVLGDVWVIESNGSIVEQGKNVHFSWWKARVQLAQQMGQYVACKPMEQDDNSVALIPLQGRAREVAADVVARLEAGETLTVEPF